jgi:hypothetical protein
VDIRAQELQEISARDIKAEGFNCERELMELWNKLHGNGAWQKNPYIWALTFRVERKADVKTMQ